MTADSSAIFLAAVREYQLLDDHQLDEATSVLQPRYPQSAALADELQRRGWLTPYQVRQLRDGAGHTLVLGQYILLDLLGQGGMGQVFKAHHRIMKRVVALKIILQSQLASPAAIHRFHREIQAVAQMAHPNVVIAYDADQVDDTHFFVMEYVEGVDLAKLVKQHGALPTSVACEYVRQAALGLQHAHERGLVHRDIKPSNLLVTTTGVPAGRPGAVKILDMGLARLRQSCATGSDEPSLTKTGAVMGTPDYMAPEQARDSRSVDIRADLYSLGCTLHFLLTARAVFPADTLQEKFYKHWFEAPPPIDQANVPGDVVALVQKLLAKSPEDRFQTPAELAAALAPFCPTSTDAVASIPFTTPASASDSKNQKPRTQERNAAKPFQTLTPEVIDGVRQSPRMQGSATDREERVDPNETKSDTWKKRTPVPPSNDGLQPPSDWRHKTNSTTQPAASRPRGKALSVMAVVGVCGLLGLGFVFWKGGRRPGQTTTAPPADYAESPPTSSRTEPPPASAQASNPRMPPVFKTSQIKLDPPNIDPPTVEPPKAIPLNVTSPTVEPSRSPAKYAVLVGVKQYETAELKNLPNAASDMEQFAKALRAVDYQPEHVLLMTQSPPTDEALLPRANNLRRELRGLLQRLTKADSVVVALECQSVQFKGSEETYFCLADARLEERQTLVALGELYRELSSCRAGFKLLLVDACRKDPLAEAPPTIETESVSRPQKQQPPDGIAAWFSSSVGETGYEQRERKQGIFFTTLGEGLQKGISNLEASARGQVFAYVQKNYRQPARQTPERLGVTRGPAPVPGLESLTAPDFVGELFNSGENGHTDVVTSVAFSPDGLTALSGSQDQTALLWDLEAGKTLQQLAPNTYSVVWSVAFSADGRRALLGCGGDKEDGKLKPGSRFHNNVRLWNLTSRLEIRTIPAPDKADKDVHEQFVTSVAFAPDGQTILSGSDDSTIRLWNAETGRLVHCFRGHTNRVKCVAFSPDGQRILSAGEDGSLRLWSVETRKPIHVFEHAHERSITSVAFSPDGRYALTGSDDRTIRLWDLLQLTEVRRFDLEPAAPMRSVAISPDGTRALTGGADTLVRLWDVTTGKQLQVFKGHTKAVNAIAYSPDGRRFVSGGDDRTIRLWALPH